MLCVFSSMQFVNQLKENSMIHIAEFLHPPPRLWKLSGKQVWITRRRFAFQWAIPAECTLGLFTSPNETGMKAVLSGCH
jgi:hypothetical protein